MSALARFRAPCPPTSGQQRTVPSLSLSIMMEAASSAWAPLLSVDPSGYCGVHADRTMFVPSIRRESRQTRRYNPSQSAQLLAVADAFDTAADALRTVGPRKARSVGTNIP